jgi:hypothetical protein
MVTDSSFLTNETSFQTSADIPVSGYLEEQYRIESEQDLRELKLFQEVERACCDSPTVSDLNEFEMSNLVESSGLFDTDEVDAETNRTVYVALKPLVQQPQPPSKKVSSPTPRHVDRCVETETNAVTVSPVQIGANFTCLGGRDFRNVRIAYQTAAVKLRGSAQYPSIGVHVGSRYDPSIKRSTSANSKRADYNISHQMPTAIE